MKIFWYFILFLPICFIGFSSCGGDDAPPQTACSTAWGTDLINEFTAISNAADAYSNDLSAANCDALKAAYQAYINALRPYGDCAALTGQDRTDFNTALNQSEASLATIC